jgi:pimeloyl-ACP methyl ester carboxylesterase
MLETMSSYIEVGALNTWYEEYGAGDPLVLLHPGGADARAFSYELMAQDTIRFLETVVRRPAHLVGMSDGATVGLLVCLQRPDLASRLVVVAGVFHRDGWAAGALDADDDPPAFFLDSYRARCHSTGARTTRSSLRSWPECMPKSR